jgi:NDP-sugar pyrophosphorylase family protein
MQAVILAAGRGKRMGTLTQVTPKPLLEVNGKSLLEYKLDALPHGISEVIIVVGYYGDRIKQKIGNSYHGISIKYAEQSNLSGTASALHSAKHLLKERFLVMMGDDIYSTEDIARCMNYPWAVCGKRVANEERGGEIFFNEKNSLTGIQEAKHYIEKGVVNTALYALSNTFFEYPMEKVPSSGEYGLPHTLVRIACDTHVEVIASENPWIQVSNANDLEQATQAVKR